MEKGTVFNIQRYTINDGPGIRTEIFVKGCMMKCKWCSNPESQRLAKEPGVYPVKCISEEKCGLCIKACRQQALLFGREKIAGIDRSRCVGCTGARHHRGRPQRSRRYHRKGGKDYRKRKRKGYGRNETGNRCSRCNGR